MILFIQDFFWLVQCINSTSSAENYRQCLCSVPKNWTVASEQQITVLGICKRLILKPTQNESSSKPTRRMLSPVGTFRVDPKWATSESGKDSRCLLAEPLPRTLPRKQKAPILFPPLPFATHCVSFPWESPKEYFDYYRQNCVSWLMPRK